LIGGTWQQILERRHLGLLGRHLADARLDGSPVSAPALVLGRAKHVQPRTVPRPSDGAAETGRLSAKDIPDAQTWHLNRIGIGANVAGPDADSVGLIHREGE